MIEHFEAVMRREKLTYQALKAVNKEEFKIDNEATNNQLMLEEIRRNHQSESKESTQSKSEDKSPYLALPFTCIAYFFWRRVIRLSIFNSFEEML